MVAATTTANIRALAPHFGPTAAFTLLNHSQNNRDGNQTLVLAPSFWIVSNDNNLPTLRLFSYETRILTNKQSG